MQKVVMKRPVVAISSVLLVALIGCAGTNSFDNASDLGLTDSEASSTSKVVSQALEGDPLYAGLPAGPRDTGTYPEFRDEPTPQITNPSQADTNRIIAEMTALNAGHQAGKISTAQYNRRLAILKRLASSHSPAMLKRIDEQSTF